MTNGEAVVEYAPTSRFGDDTDSQGHLFNVSSPSDLDYFQWHFITLDSRRALVPQLARELLEKAEMFRELARRIGRHAKAPQRRKEIRNEATLYDIVITHPDGSSLTRYELVPKGFAVEFVESFENNDGLRAEMLPVVVVRKRGK